jgi:DNA-binding NarL/FixJ family response regulator
MFDVHEKLSEANYRKAALLMHAVPEFDRTAVIVDRYPLWVEAVSAVLNGAGVDVVGRATSHDEALKLVLEHRPSLFVTDVDGGGPGLDGIGCLREVCRQVPSVKALVLASYDDTAHIDAALAAGAVAYVLKTAHPEDVAAAVRQVFDHSIYLAGARVPTPAASSKSSVVADSPGLTRRELEILQLVAEGHSNAQLATMLWVTEQTVKFHLSNIYRKLDVSNRTEASRWAQLQGLLPASSAAAVVVA